MKEQEEENRIRNYLLGQLDEGERHRLEENVFTDSEFFDRVLMIEDELVEDFVFDEMPATDKENFVSHFLSTPERLRKLQATRDLKYYSDCAFAVAAKQSKPPLSFLRQHSVAWGLSVAAVLVIVCGVGYLIQTRNSLQREIAQLNSTEALATGQLDFSIEPAPILLRSEPGAPNAEKPPFVIPANAMVVRIRLPLPASGSQNYQAQLIKEPDLSLFTLNQPKRVDSSSGKQLVVRVPARVLSPGEYRLLLKATTLDGQIENLGSYVFRVGDAVSH